MARQRCYPKAIIHASLRRLSDPNTEVAVRRNLIRILSRALVQAYHFGKASEMDFELIASEILKHFSNLTVVSAGTVFLICLSVRDIRL